jgi:hypothetical protein
MNLYDRSMSFSGHPPYSFPKSVTNTCAKQPNQQTNLSTSYSIHPLFVLLGENPKMFAEEFGARSSIDFFFSKKEFKRVRKD